MGPTFSILVPEVVGSPPYVLGLRAPCWTYMLRLIKKLGSNFELSLVFSILGSGVIEGLIATD